MRVETSSIKDLPDMHRMGHTCANLNGDLFFVWGGSDESVAYLSARNTHLWIYETLTGYWRHRSCSGECPPYLSGTTSSLIGQKMFVFGGHSTAQDNWLNSLYCLDLETFIWKDLGSQAKAEPTKPIRSDKCVSWSHDGRLYVFGGYGWSQTEHLLQLLDKQKDLQLTPDYRWPKFGWNNQLVEFDPRDNTWRWPSYSGKCPSARAAHSGALMGGYYYLFGGRDSRERLNDLYTLDMKTLQWNQIAVFSSDPSHSNLERPIRHLLEPPDADDEIEEEEEVVGVVVEDQDLVMNAAIEEEMVIQEAAAVADSEQLTPSPSSSAHFSRDNLSAASSSSSSASSSADNGDDDPDYPFEYPHPSHLLERWSLSSSHQSGLPSSSSIDNVNCQQQHQQQQLMLDQSNRSNVFDDLPNHQPMENAQDLIEESSHQQPQADDIINLQGNNQQPPPLSSLSDQSLLAREMEVSAPLPTGRSFSSFTPISDDDIMLYGGVSSQDENLNDCWLFNTNHNRWTQVDLKHKHPRLWHTGSRTKNNEVVVIGGSCSDKIDEFCTDMLTISLEPKSLKRLALDSVARSIRMRSIHRVKDLPSTICKLIKLRKQAIALTMRRYHRTAVAQQPSS